MTEAEYQDLLTQERLQGQIWLRQHLELARRRYWKPWNDPVEHENRMKAIYMRSARRAARYYAPFRQTGFGD